MTTLDFEEPILVRERANHERRRIP